MHMFQTGPRQPSPIPGKDQNCDKFGSFEAAGTSSSAALCHGGTYSGDNYTPCPVRTECRSATVQSAQNTSEHFRLPVLNQSSGLRPLASQNLYRSPVQQQPPQQQTFAPMRAPQQQQSSSGLRPFQPMTFQSGQGTTLPGRMNPQVPQQVRAYADGGYPQPVMPPPEYPLVMRTPYAAPMPTTGVGITPTFLPLNDEHPIERLGKNAMQGAAGAIGWHLFDYLRNVDLFKFRS